MTIYETIKAAISVKQAAEHYGLKVNRNRAMSEALGEDVYHYHLHVVYRPCTSPIRHSDIKISFTTHLFGKIQYIGIE